MFEPANAGDRKIAPMPAIYYQRAAAHFMGSAIQFDSDPGAYAPGFMLSPASQARQIKIYAFACFAG